MLPPGRELDTTLSLLLNGETRRNPPAYSTSPLAADRLLRRMARQGISARVEEWGNLWYCTLLQGESRLSSGSGETRPLAISRAVVSCRFAVPPPVKQGPPTKSDRFIPRPATEESRQCEVCGSPLNPARARATLRRICNVCSWKRDKERLSEPRLPPPETNRRGPSAS
ncbi:MAG: hypothetical protein LC796_00235 [Acidobacteria bacterium]|nr:hypothetical protein [Acidobacteriota bacterium]MCA1609427.1 hypothetical protein [Acidobacteriota bacterium]